MGVVLSTGNSQVFDINRADQNLLLRDKSQEAGVLPSPTPQPAILRYPSISELLRQKYASPGIYARAFLEGRLPLHQLENFRRELKPGGGLASYPHPWLMPDFWEFPTVSI